MTTFTLTEKKQQAFDEWKAKIKDLFGDYGLFEYRFTPNGIATELEIYSHNTKTVLDLTDVSDW